MAELDYYEEYQKGLRHAISWKDLAEEDLVHLTGAWYTAKYVRAAHLGPKSLGGDELKHLFGVGEVVLEDPRNGITLWRTLEQGLDNGTIAIIPVLPTDEGELTRWKCILANQALREQSWTTFMGESYKWKSLHSLPTIALLRDIVRICHSAKKASPHQLAAERLVIFDRYLYSHFVITSLYAKKRGDTQWVENIESRKILWASMGPYLAVSLGRDISGFELPNAFITGKTFDLPAPAPENDLALAASLRAAMIRSARAADEANVR
ncbi:hypothetical protein MaudCBS49596_007482 [Microsporum audouinii]